MDVFHQPTGQVTFGVPLGSGGSAYVGANIAATLMNIHLFKMNKKDNLIELGIGQTGISYQGGKYSLQEAGVLEGHLTDKISLLATGGFNLNIDRYGLDTHPVPFFNLGLVFHGPPIDGSSSK